MSIEIRKRGYWEDVYVDGRFVGQLDNYGYFYKDGRYHDVSAELSHVDKQGFDWENKEWISTDNVEGDASKQHKAVVKKLVRKGFI